MIENIYKFINLIGTEYMLSEKKNTSELDLYEDVDKNKIHADFDHITFID